MADHTRRGYRPVNMLMIPGDNGVFKTCSLTSQVQAAPGLIIYRFTHSMYFANCQQLYEEITSLAKEADPPLSWICIDASAVDDVDYSAAKTIHSLNRMLQEKEIRLVVAQTMLDVVHDSQFYFRTLLEEGMFFRTLAEMMSSYQQYVEAKREIKQR